MKNQIREVRKAAKITQEELAKVIGVTHATLSRYESGVIDPPTSQLQAIAAALGVSVSDLLGQTEKPQRVRPWGLFLQEKLESVGYSIGFYEEDAYIWINYPDGTLEVTDAELRELDQSTDSYLRFKLQELRERHPNDFRLKRKRPQGSQVAPEAPPAPLEWQGTTPPPVSPETPSDGA